ncbi:MAG TPA: hypothetical protein VFP40_06730, partial [Terriglobales bacterium]|nr:hypothetical protein [Terriglobales bacterium]
MRKLLTALLLLTATTSFAQRRQPNKPSEPSIQPSPTAQQMQEEKFPEEAGKIPPAKPEEPKSPFAGMKYRLVGPFRGGRVVAVSGVPGDVNTYYMGSTGGGMWKS